MTAPLYDCGRTIDQHKTPSVWPTLHLNGEGMGLEYRTCLGCHSTFAVELESEDADV